MNKMPAMKTRLTLFTFLLICITRLSAQSGFSGGSIVPYSPKSPLFGKDIIIDNQPTQNQRNTAICSAFNGWLFAFSAPYDSTDHTTHFYLLKSVDSGISWNIIHSDIYGGPYV